MAKKPAELDPFENARRRFDPNYAGEKPTGAVIRPGTAFPGSVPAPANVVELTREPEPLKPDGISRKGQAGDYLQKLRAHRKIVIEQYGLEDSYISVEKFLKRDLHSAARSLAWTDAELYGVIPVGSGKQKAELLGAVVRLSRAAGVMRVDARHLVIETLREDGEARSEVPKPTIAGRGARLVMLWDLPPRPASTAPSEFHDDQVTPLDTAVELRNNIQALLREDLDAATSSQCSSCKFFAGDGSVGFCREAPPFARNAELLAARLGVPVSTLPVAAAWPLTSRTSGCGYHQAAGETIETKSSATKR